MTPLGPGLRGFTTDYGAWVEVPACLPGGELRILELTTRDSGHSWAVLAPGNRRRFGEALVAAVNRLRESSGCTGDPLPPPAVLPDPVWTPVQSDTSFCGLPGAQWGTVVPADRRDRLQGVVQGISGAGDSDRVCRLVAADGKLLFSMWIMRGFAAGQLDFDATKGAEPGSGIWLYPRSEFEWSARITADCPGGVLLVTVLANSPLQLPIDLARNPPLGTDHRAVCAMAGGR